MWNGFLCELKWYAWILSTYLFSSTLKKIKCSFKKKKKKKKKKKINYINLLSYHHPIHILIFVSFPLNVWYTEKLAGYLGPPQEINDELDQNFLAY
ncbi:hypothetical protein F8388_019993 [Cannabis sativa]|uniref:Uncharacterized protein n=1 Tax=Cannabis sativa TaxID=3483 RepID=A0A7J6GTT7_CANSA|nr:hypothetical protein F8388_019993 [Cannabis sativa]